MHTPPGEWHWHGASRPVHDPLAIFEAPAEGPETEWAAQVTDAEYSPPRREAVAAWTADELDRIGPVDEIQAPRGAPAAA